MIFSRSFNGENLIFPEENAILPIREKAKELNLIYSRNFQLVDEILSSYHSPRKKFIFFLFEYVRYGSREGAYSLYWNRGKQYDRVVSIRYNIQDSVNPLMRKEMKGKYKSRVMLEYILSGLVDFLYTTLAGYGHRDLKEYNFMPIFLMEPRVYDVAKPGMDIYLKKPYMISGFGKPEEVIPNSILFDLYSIKPFGIEKMNIDSPKVWNKSAIYKIRKEIASLAVDESSVSYKADYTIRNMNEFLCTRHPGEFYSENSLIIQRVIKIRYSIERIE